MPASQQEALGGLAAPARAANPLGCHKLCCSSRLSGCNAVQGQWVRVYEALARELRLPAEQKPMELLLLIELMAHRASHQVYGWQMRL